MISRLPSFRREDWLTGAVSPIGLRVVPFAHRLRDRDGDGGGRPETPASGKCRVPGTHHSRAQ
jgi:hypothetical protein